MAKTSEGTYCQNFVKVCKIIGYVFVRIILRFSEKIFKIITVTDNFEISCVMKKLKKNHI